MKQILLIILACAAMISFNACSDSDYTDRYPDPSKTSNVSCEKLMTGIFQAGNTYTLSSYYRYFTFETQQIGKFAQTMGFTNEKGMYLGMGESYNNDRWKNFYNVLIIIYRRMRNRTMKYSYCFQPFTYTIICNRLSIYGEMSLSVKPVTWRSQVMLRILTPLMKRRKASMKRCWTNCRISIPSWLP